MDEEDEEESMRKSLPQSTSSFASPLPSPIASPPSEMVLTHRRRSSLIPPDATAIVGVSPTSSRSPRGSRRGSTAFLLGDDIVVQLAGKRKRSRRMSRMSSIMTTSSTDDMMLQIDESMSEEEVLETLKTHKQIITSVKTQTWPMHRKLRVLRKAKNYIKKHEGELKQSKQAKDIFATWRTALEKTLKKVKREILNLLVQMTPWEMRIKRIESQFGSVVASYFTFLRWVFWINTFISVFICVILMVPEILRGHDDPTGMRKEVKDQESALTLQSIWDFEGYLKFSPIFYGYYSSEEATQIGYRLPLAYFLTSIILYLFSFFCILRKMTQIAKSSRVGASEDEYVFCWKIFTSWDYLIGHSETAYNKVSSIVMGLKEVILEEKERKKEEKKDWKRIALRVLANFFVLFLLGSSAYAVVLVVERSLDMPEKPGWLRENEVTLVVAGIGIVYPNIFNLIGIIEAYHPGIQLRWQLARILVLNLLNLYTLMFSLFGKVDTMTSSLLDMKRNITRDKKYRMRWETEMMVTVLMDRVERMERGIDDYYDQMGEGRFIWSKAEPSPHPPPSRPPTTPEPGWTSSSFSPGIPVTVVHRPVVIKDEWTSTNINGQEQDPGGGDVFIDIIEGRRAVPSVVRRPSSGSSPDPGGSSFTSSQTDMDGGTEEGIDFTSPGTTLEGEFEGIDTDTTDQVTLPTTQSKATRKTTKPDSITTMFTTLTDFTTTTQFEADVTTMAYEEPTYCPGMEPKIPITDDDLLLLEESNKELLRTLCWETMFGQELTKLTVMDFLLTAISTVIGDFLRAVIVRYCNKKACFFWDLEKKFPGYSDFPIAENILHLVNNQGMVWLGMFFAPGLPAINTIKLAMMMYLRSWAVLTCNVPHETVFKASGNNFYYALLLLMLFICCLPVAYTCVWLEPSWHCGPFSEYERVYHILTHYIESKLPDTINKVVDYLTSPGSIIPLLLLLILIIYYLTSTVAQLKEANEDLKSQIRKEKDILNPEMSKNAPDLALPEKKHVRIQEEIRSDVSDKTQLITGDQSPC